MIADAAQRRLAVAVLLSASLHAGAVLWLSSLPGGSSQPAASRSVTLRFLSRELSSEFPSEAESRLASLPAAAVLDAGVPAMPVSPLSVREPEPGPAPGVENGGFALAGGMPRYFPGSELDRRPIAIASIEPKYPEQAGDRGEYLVLRILINEGGAVDAVIPLAGEPGDPFRESAVAAFSKARFSPGFRNGIAVKSQMLVEVMFEAIGTPPAPAMMSKPVAGVPIAPARR